jgi:hypothetical protein
MAIVINGSGTVTGLSVGGLPDGTVDNDTVASGLASSKLTGALPAISGAALTGVQVAGTAAFSARIASSGSQSISNSTSTVIPFADEEFDSDGVFNNSTYKFTAPSAGKYYFNWSVRKANFSSARFLLDIYKNSTGVTTFETGDGSSVYGTVGGSIILDLAQNDTVHGEVLHNQGGSQNIDKPNSRFSGFKLIT